ncbi:cysteine hydrolase family protein [Chloroflexota bacterium]
MKALQRVRVNPGNAILVIVDVQNEFCKPTGKRCSETCARVAPGVIKAIHGLAEQARSNGIPVIYIQSVRTGQEPEYTVFGLDPILKLGTWASQIVDELKPQQGDTVIQKFSHDPFYRPDLDRVLQGMVKEPTRHCAIVTGGNINICLYHAVLGFHLRNYWTVLPVDSTYYASEYEKGIALHQFSNRAHPNIFLSRSDLIEFSTVKAAVRPVIRPIQTI